MSDDGWVTITREPCGRSAGVTVSWRISGGRKTPALAVSLGADICRAMNLERPTKEPAHAYNNRVVVQHNLMRGRLRIRRATTEPTIETRAAAWKDGGATITVPLAHVELDVKKPAQDVKWALEDGVLEVALPHWACPPVRIETGRAA